LAIFPDQGFQWKIGGNAGSNNKQTNVEERGEWSFSDSERKIEILEDFLCSQSFDCEKCGLSCDRRLGLRNRIKHRRFSGREV